MLTLTLPHTCRDTEGRRSDRRTQRRPRGGGQSHMPLMPGQSRLSEAVSSGHREFGPDSGSSQGGQEEDGWQPVSSLATGTHQPRGLGPAPLQKQPALPYSGRVRRGRHFLRAERERAAPSQSREQGTCPQAGRLLRPGAGGARFVPGGGRSQASRAGAPPRRQQSCDTELARRLGAGSVHPCNRGGVQKRGGPEVRTF